VIITCQFVQLLPSNTIKRQARFFSCVFLFFHFRFAHLCPQEVREEATLMITRLCRGARMSEEQTRLDVCHRKVNLTLSGQIRPGEWRDVTGRLRNIFSDASVTIGGRNYSGEYELARTMVEWPNEAILLQVWSGWRKAAGPPSKPVDSLPSVLYYS
jgi:hypothetical protein